MEISMARRTPRQNVTVRMSEAERWLLELGAQRYGLTVSDYARRIMVARAASDTEQSEARPGARATTHS